MEAATFQEDLEGQVSEQAQEGELRILREVLAGRYLARVRRAIDDLDLEEAARALGKASHGVEAAMSPLEGLSVLVTLVGQRPTPQKFYPSVLDAGGFGGFLRAARGAFPHHLHKGALTLKGLTSWKQELEGMVGQFSTGSWSEDVLSEKVLEFPGLDFKTLRALESGDPASFQIAQEAYARTFWVRRALFEILGKEGIENTLSLQRSLDAGKLRFLGRVKNASAGDELVVSFGGGGLGTLKLPANGKIEHDVALSRLGRFLLSRPVMEIRMVRNRKVVYQRSLAAGDLFRRAKVVPGEVGVRKITLEPIALPEPVGSLKVRVPVWPQLLDGRVPGEAPSKGSVRLAGVKTPGTLSKWGTAVFRDLRPGWQFLAFTAKNSTGSILYRSFGLAEVLPGQEVTVELSLPVGEAPIAKKQNSLWSVKKFMTDLAASYRAGKISLKSFRKALGATYRAHRNFYGDRKKDKEFVKKVALTMRDVMTSVQPSALKEEDLSPRIEAVREGFQDLRGILPDTLQRPQPEAELESWVSQLSDHLFGDDAPGGFRSILHLRRAIRKGSDGGEELAGVSALLKEVLTSRLEELLTEFRGIVKDYLKGYTLYHLGGSDYEESLLRLAAQEIFPISDLLRRGRRLAAERTAEDLSLRVLDETARVDAAEARLKAFRIALRRLQGRASEKISRWDVLRARAGTVWKGIPEKVGKVLRTWRRSRTLQSGDPRIWIHSPEIENILPPLVKAVHARKIAEVWKELYEFQVKSNLRRLFELDASEAELEELMGLHPSERRKALNQKLSPIFRRFQQGKLADPPWPGPLPLGAFRTMQVVLASFAREAWSLKPFVASQEEALRALRAEFDVTKPETWEVVARKLEAWNAQIDAQRKLTPLHEALLPGALTRAASTLEQEVRDRVKARPRTAFKDSAQEYFASRGWSFLGEEKDTEAPLSEVGNEVAGEAPSEVEPSENHSTVEAPSFPEHSVGDLALDGAPMTLTTTTPSSILESESSMELPTSP
jgi:hypothetical protein